MPATAGRVRMPSNNRVHSSAALQTHGIWQSAIGYDPYAPVNNSPDISVNAMPEAENPYLKFQGLMALARVTASHSDNAVRGACKKCGRVGHLTFQCRNFLGIKENDPEAVMFGLDQNLKGNDVKKNVDGIEEEEEGESSDSEIERIIADRYGKKSNRRRKTSRKNQEESDSDSDSVPKKKRERSRRNRRREASDSEDEEEVRMKRRRKVDDERRPYERKSRKEKRTSRR